MKIFTHILIVLSALLPLRGAAVDAGAYASHSRLSAGAWVKVSVTSSGVYAITARQLHAWGFSDIAKVRVYGYGAAPISEILDDACYIDDLPQVPTAVDGDRLVFYASGPESWTITADGVAVNNPNIYTERAYYYVTETEDARAELPQSGTPGATDPEREGMLLFHHEVDRVSVGEAGYDLVGENLATQSPRRITVDAPGGHAVMQCAVVNGSRAASCMAFAVNGCALPQADTDIVRPADASEFVHGVMSVTTRRFDFDGTRLDLDVSVERKGGLDNCWLNYVSLAVTLPLRLDGSSLHFLAGHPQMYIGGADAKDAVVWDVTDPMSITQMRIQAHDDGIAWTNDRAGRRSYAVWRKGLALPAPEHAGAVANQNLHALTGAELVIFTPKAFAAQATRLARWHEQSCRPLSTAVIGLEEVYNEFASGVPCAAALRRCLKMLHDRGASGRGVMPRYVLLMGKPTYDHRHLTSQYDGGLDYPTVPAWICGDRAAQFNDNTAFVTDDITAMLADGSGGNLGSDALDVAIGRLPVSTLAEATRIVDKIIDYADNAAAGTWRNTMLFIADDGDNGTHLADAEQMIAEIDRVAPDRMLTNKIYVDAYPIVNSTCAAGRTEMWRQLREGAFWWNFSGHANRYSWTDENMLTYNDINNMRLRRIPVLMAATCNFMRWDSRTVSGAEVLMHERYGGTAATISATRPVYIADNARFSQAMGRAIGCRLSDGLMPAVGDVYRMAKNDVRSADGRPAGDTNRLRYALMGDPAMPMAVPDHVVTLDSIDGVAVSEANQLVLSARQNARLSGSVRTPGGAVVADFDGTVAFDLYDAEFSTTTLGERDDNVKITYEQHGARLCSGSAPVQGGRFAATVPMPGEIDDNFRPATLNMCASAADGRMAAGLSRAFYVYGYDDSADADVTAPVIEALYLNHESWRSGEAVNDSPLVIARISDDVAINMSLAGIGHQMTITVDDDRTYNDVSLYYTPNADGTPGGIIAYPLSGLTDGHHALTLRVWDTSANSASATVEMAVRTDLPPTIYRVYADANPAVSETNFYVTHNRPEADLTVKITVYTLMGREIWSGNTTGRADMTRTAPVNWNLCDYNGRRVARGIYVYRAEISEANGDTYSTASRKLAITGQ